MIPLQWSNYSFSFIFNKILKVSNYKKKICFLWLLVLKIRLRIYLIFNDFNFLIIGGTMFGTTPGGTKIIYDRLYLMKIRDSPASQVSFCFQH